MLQFVYVEIAYFWRWWRQQSADVKALTHRLVQQEQLQFINGGWCMSDEAAPFYVDMIDQQTLGSLFLLSTFGPKAIPRTGWQARPWQRGSVLMRRRSTRSGTPTQWRCCTH